MAKITTEGRLRTLYQVEEPICRVLLAHGAGAGDQHEFISSMALALSAYQIEVVSFNFPYMQIMYENNSKRPPNNNKQLVAHFNSEMTLMLAKDDLPLWLAGKSMGGRIATQLLADPDIDKRVAGGIVYGYPFIPPGKPEKYSQRVEHFADIDLPVLICQGERDTFGNRALLADKTLGKTINIKWITSGDHSFKPLKSTGLTSNENILHAARLTAEFMVGSHV